MPREFSRPQRVAEQLQRELAQLIQREVKDPRLGMVTVAAVDVSRDLSYATVWVTFLGRDTQEEIKEALSVLADASGFLRSLLGKRIHMRHTPTLRFKYDEAQARGREMTSLIKEARKRDSDND
ncbi:MAG: 30S ribosome-binding factor RbfA [Gammaproteobacteria bacterium]|jgi:ribosome-binding factor A